MSLRIKLCGVRTVEDALLCAAAGADEIGVIFAARSKRCVSLEMARWIRDALPMQVPVVGVFQGAPIDEVASVVAEVGLQAAQLHGDWPGAVETAIPLYAAVQVSGEDSLAPRPGAARLLLDGPAGGSGISFAWSLAARARAMQTVPLFIAGGLNADNVAQAIAQARPDGVDVASGIENAEGFKDPARVRAFVRAVRGVAFK